YLKSMSSASASPIFQYSGIPSYPSSVPSIPPADEGLQSESCPALVEISRVGVKSPFPYNNPSTMYAAFTFASMLNAVNTPSGQPTSSVHFFWISNQVCFQSSGYC